MLGWFLTRVLMIGLPIVELLLVVWVGNTIGWLPTLALLAAGAVVGFVIMRAAGRDAFRAVSAPMQRRQPYVEIDETTGTAQTVHPTAEPTQEEVQVASAELRQSGLLFVSGLLFAIPGFISDALGALLLLPVSRRVVAARMRSERPAPTVVIRGETIVPGGGAGPPPGAWPHSEADGAADPGRPTVIRGEILPPQRPIE